MILLLIEMVVIFLMEEGVIISILSRTQLYKVRLRLKVVFGGADIIVLYLGLRMGAKLCLRGMI